VKFLMQFICNIIFYFDQLKLDCYVLKTFSIRFTIR